MSDRTFSNPYGAPADGYVRSLLELLGDRDPLAVLAATPAELRRALDGVADERLRRPEAPGRWSALAVAAHLADSELVWGWRLRLALAQERPRLGGYDQDAWAARLRYAEADIEEALRRFSVLRESHLALLGTLAPADWERVAVHEERGEESVRRMSRLYAAHDLVHLAQVARILGS